MNSSERYTTFYFIFFWWLTWVAILWQVPLKEYSFVEHDHFLSHPMRSWPLLWGEIRSACVSAAVSSCGNRTRLRRSPQWSPPFHLGPQEVLARCTDGLAPETEINKQSNKLKMNIKDSKHKKKKKHNLAVTSIFSFSSTKKASPLSPSFMCRSTDSPFISMSTYSHSKQRAHHRDNRKSIMLKLKWHKYSKTLTIFSLERSTPSLPKRTWNGEHWKDPSGCRTTTTSIPPVRVAGLRPRYSSFTVTNTVSASWFTIFMVWD